MAEQTKKAYGFLDMSDVLKRREEMGPDEALWRVDRAFARDMALAPLKARHPGELEDLLRKHKREAEELLQRHEDERRVALARWGGR